jgi:outer membrane protein assembly factor BamB
MIPLLAILGAAVLLFFLWFGVAYAIAQATGQPLWEVLDEALWEVNNKVGRIL